MHPGLIDLRTEPSISVIIQRDTLKANVSLCTRQCVVVYSTEPDEKQVGSDRVKMILDRDWSEKENSSIEFNWTSISAAGYVFPYRIW